MTRQLLTILILSQIISCGQKISDNKKNDNSPISTDNSNGQTKKYTSRYFENSFALTILDTTTDSSTFVTFMNAIKTMNTPIQFDSLLNYNSDEFWIDKRVDSYDSIMFFKNDSGRILSNRILCEDESYRNELSFLIKYFKRLYNKYAPYVKNFESYKQIYWDTMPHSNLPLVCVHFKITLSHRQRQNFYLLYITASPSGGFGSNRFLCTFNNKGQLQDCMIADFSGYNEENHLTFDNNDNIIGNYLHFQYYDNCKTKVDTMNYKIKISKRGQFILANKIKGFRIDNDCEQ